MDNFADFIEMLDFPDPSCPTPSEHSGDRPRPSGESDRPKVKEIKVAIIDDGVKSGNIAVDDKIDSGESWVQQSKPYDPYSPYTASVTGHGTVIAYYINRVCPKARLYIAKLNPDINKDSARVTFTIESATKVFLIHLVNLLGS